MYMWHFNYYAGRTTGPRTAAYSISSTTALDNHQHSNSQGGSKADRLYYLAIIITNITHLVYNLILALLTLYSFAIEPIDSSKSMSSSSTSASISFLIYCLITTLILGHSLNFLIYLVLFDAFRQTALWIFCQV